MACWRTGMVNERFGPFVSVSLTRPSVCWWSIPRSLIITNFQLATSTHTWFVFTCPLPLPCPFGSSRLTTTHDLASRLFVRVVVCLVGHYIDRCSINSVICPTQQMGLLCVCVCALHLGVTISTGQMQLKVYSLFPFKMWWIETFWFYLQKWPVRQWNNGISLHNKHTCAQHNAIRLKYHMKICRLIQCDYIWANCDLVFLHFLIN